MIDWVVLCQHAMHDEHGLLSIIGIFEAVTTAKLPARVPKMFVAACLLGAPGSRVQFELIPYGPNGEPLDRSYVHESVVSPDRDRTEQFVMIGGLELPAFGIYRFVVKASGEQHVATLTVKPTEGVH